LEGNDMSFTPHDPATATAAEVAKKLTDLRKKYVSAIGRHAVDAANDELYDVFCKNLDLIIAVLLAPSADAGLRGALEPIYRYVLNNVDADGLSDRVGESLNALQAFIESGAASPAPNEAGPTPAATNEAVDPMHIAARLRALLGAVEDSKTLIEGYSKQIAAVLRATPAPPAGCGTKEKR
jgi:hypothetical protein